MRRPILIKLIGFAVLAVLVSALFGYERLQAHGTLDQALTGDPECNAMNFRATISSGGSIRQEFVPSKSGLTAVDVCLSIGTGITFQVNILAGTAATPGEVLASALATTTTAPGRQWVHLELPTTIYTEPNAMLVLEIPESATFAWTGTCGSAFGGPCTTADPDLYPPGRSNFTDFAFAVGDFAFRTYAGPPTLPGQGDVDCDGDVDSVDSLKELRHVAGLSVSQNEPCPEIGSEVASLFGDVDCDDDVDSVDSLKILRSVAGLSVSQIEPCPDIGIAVEVTASSPVSGSPVSSAAGVTPALALGFLGMGGLWVVGNRLRKR